MTILSVEIIKNKRPVMHVIVILTSRFSTFGGSSWALVYVSSLRTLKHELSFSLI